MDIEAKYTVVDRIARLSRLNIQEHKCICKTNYMLK